MFDQISPQIPNQTRSEQNANKLPIHHLKQEILASIISNRVTVVSGDAGIGKTTQVSKFLM